MFGEWYFITENIGECRVSVLAFERRCSVKHFVYQNTQSPPVHSTGVAIALDDLRRDVLLRPYKGVGAEVGNAGLGVNRRQGSRRVSTAT